MTGKRHSPEEILAKLRVADEALARGDALQNVIPQLGVSAATYHRWRRRYGRGDPDRVVELKRLEEENQRLKRSVEVAEEECRMLDRIARGEF